MRASVCMYAFTQPRARVGNWIKNPRIFVARFRLIVSFRGFEMVHGIGASTFPWGFRRVEGRWAGGFIMILRGARTRSGIFKGGASPSYDESVPRETEL